MKDELPSPAAAIQDGWLDEPLSRKAAARQIAVANAMALYVMDGWMDGMGFVDEVDMVDRMDAGAVPVYIAARCPWRPFRPCRPSDAG